MCRNFVWSIFLLISASPALAQDTAGTSSAKSCPDLLPLLDTSISRSEAKNLYNFYTDHHGWNSEESTYSLAPSSIKTYTISVAVSGDGASDTAVQNPIVCELPTKWQARSRSRVDLKTPRSLFDFPTLAASGSAANQSSWSSLGGLLTMSVAPAFNYNIAWFLEFIGANVDGIGQDIQQKYPFLGHVDIVDPLTALPQNSVIAVQIDPARDSASNIALPNTAKSWIVRTGDQGLSGQAFPAWKPAYDDDAATLMRQPLTPANAYAGQTYILNHGGISITAFDILDVDAGEFGYSPKYCDSNSCLLTGNQAMSRYINDIVTQARRSDRSLSVTVVYRINQDTFARGSYQFTPQTGFITQSFVTFPSLGNTDLAWLAQYRAALGIAP